MEGRRVGDLAANISSVEDVVEAFRNEKFGT